MIRINDNVVVEKVAGPRHRPNMIARKSGFAMLCGLGVAEIEPDRRYLDADLAWSSAWLRHLFEAERFNLPELPDLRHAHRRLLPRLQRWRDASVSDIEQSVAKRDGDRLGAIDGAELAHRGLRVLVDRSLAHREDRSD